jgi:alkylation response protein AidB-like acyl-CoA dehydrogenase
MDYQPRPEDVRFLLNAVLDAPARLRALAPFAEVDEALQSQVLEEAARFVGEVVAPINRGGDEIGCRFDKGEVVSPPGFREAYQAFVDGGWPALSAATEDGGQGLPAVLEAVLYEWLSAANHGLTMAPGLLHGAYACLKHHGSDELKNATCEDRDRRMARHHVPDRSACGQRPGPGAHARRAAGRRQPARERQQDLHLRRRARPDAEHRAPGAVPLPDAPAGPKGLSLVLVPKLLPDGARNAVHCERIEEKMGLHGSPTCTMRFDDATGWLVGEAGRGLPRCS